MTTVKGRKKQFTLLNKENILNRVSEADIVMAFWPASHKLKWNHAIESPFRHDSNPSFIIGNKFGDRITYKDMGDYQYRGDVWMFVKQICGYSNFNDVLNAIDQRFMLGLGTGNPISGKSPIITWEPQEVEVKPPPFIQVVTRKWHRDELEWWNQFDADIRDLKEEHIYAPREIYRNRRKIEVVPFTFCYFYPEIEKWKLYRPLQPKRVKNTPVSKWKWDTNVPIDYVEHLEKINGCELALLAKARKDRIVLKKALELDSIAVTNAEDPSCITEEAIHYIKSNSHTQLVVSDNDKKGKEFSWYLTQEHSFKHCNVPDHYREQEGLTDFADLRRAHGREAVRQHFLQKGFIHSLKNTG